MPRDEQRAKEVLEKTKKKIIDWKMNSRDSEWPEDLKLKFTSSDNSFVLTMSSWKVERGYIIERLCKLCEQGSEVAYWLEQYDHVKTIDTLGCHEVNNLVQELSSRFDVNMYIGI